MPQFTFELREQLPPMAWLAHCADDRAHVVHGRGVETIGDDAFCEAVWDGDFSSALFDQTDLVFGSGGRHTDESITFVSAGNTVDRLHSLDWNGAILVSNSLAAILAVTGGTVALNDHTLFERFESIIRGINDYTREIPTSVGFVRLTYYRNLRWDGDSLSEVDKPSPQRSLNTFEDYFQFLKTSLTAIGANLADQRRTYSLSPIASISTGYDSPAVAAMARFAGLEESISLAQGRGDVNDSGAVIAKQMGLRPIVAQRTDALNATENVPLFIASDAKGEDAYFAGSTQDLRGRVLFSGYSGSRIWDTSESSYANIRRGDQSGLSHTEARLHFGYLHCPVPFFAGLEEQAIRRLGRQAEMKPWSVDSDYNRPICRRIVEECGVDRELFGQVKKAASVLLFDRRTFLSQSLLDDFDSWLEQNDIEIRQHKLRQELPRKILRSLHKLDPNGSVPLLRRLASEGRLSKFAFHEPKFDYLFPWAMQKAIERYHNMNLTPREMKAAI